LGTSATSWGGVAVVVSLIYLAVQIRQNTRQVQQSVELERAAAIKGANNLEPSMLAIAQDPGLARIFREGLADYSALKGDERLRFTMVMGAIVATFDTRLSEQMILGIHGGPSLGDQVQSLRRFLGTPGGHEWWRRHSAEYSPVFQEFVKEHVAGRTNPPAAATPIWNADTPRSPDRTPCSWVSTG
jgi:hypothetical protein